MDPQVFFLLQTTLIRGVGGFTTFKRNEITNELNVFKSTRFKQVCQPLLSLIVVSNSLLLVSLNFSRLPSLPSREGSLPLEEIAVIQARSQPPIFFAKLKMAIAVAKVVRVSSDDKTGESKVGANSNALLTCSVL